MKKKRIVTLILLLSMLCTCGPVYAAQPSATSTEKTEKSASETLDKSTESKKSEKANTPPDSEDLDEKDTNDKPKIIEEPTIIPVKSI